MSLLDYTGYAAALCTTGAYVPQVLRVWRTRSTHALSPTTSPARAAGTPLRLALRLGRTGPTRALALKMVLVVVAGLIRWLVCGFWKGEIPLIAANGVTL